MAQEQDPGLLDSTRGKLLLLLCRGPQTVNDLAEALGVTDNAVRAHLVSLQEDGLVRQVGLRPGTRRPHVDYELTPRGRALFPRADEPALRALLDVLRDRLPPAELAGILGQAAKKLLGSTLADLPGGEPRGRVGELVGRLQALGTGVSLEEGPDRQLTVRACGCPLASVTGSHPEICDVLARVLGELLGTQVRQRCDRNEWPRCCFEFDEGASP